MSDELKPCPFCGAPARQTGYAGGVFGPGPLYGCSNSSCEAHSALIASWNNRPVEDALRAELEELRKFRARVGDYSPWQFDDEMSEWFCKQCSARVDDGGADEVAALHAGAMAHMHKPTCAWYEPKPGAAK